MSNNFKTKILPVIIFLAGFFSCTLYGEFNSHKSSVSKQTGLYTPLDFKNEFTEKDFFGVLDIPTRGISPDPPDPPDPSEPLDSLDSLDSLNSSENPDFDFSWLKEAAEKNSSKNSSLDSTQDNQELRLLILGENHYSSVTHKFRDDLFFYLNTKSYFPLILIEQPLSYTPYIRKYLSFEDDGRALEFLKTHNFIFSFEEDLRLAEKIRKWNRKNSAKRLAIACTDIEHDMEQTMKRLIWPWFEARGQQSRRS